MKYMNISTPGSNPAISNFYWKYALNCLQKRRKEAVYEAPIDIEIGRDKETQT